MARPQVDPLRTLTDEERTWLTRVSRARAEPAAHVARAAALLAVASGASYTEAARAAGRRSGGEARDLRRRLLGTRRSERAASGVREVVVALDGAVLCDPEAQLDDELLLRHVCSYLTPDHRTLVHLVWQGGTVTEVARQLGYANHSAVSNTLKRIRAKLVLQRDL